MEIRVDGNRSTSESWMDARRVSLQDLPPISEEEQRVAEKLAISFDEYRRSKYAAELTKKGLQIRASKVGHLVEGWLRGHGFKAETTSVWLKTFDGKYRIDVVVQGDLQSVFVDEGLIDEMLDSGAREAEQRFDRIMTANFGLFEVARAS